MQLTPVPAFVAVRLTLWRFKIRSHEFCEAPPRRGGFCVEDLSDGEWDREVVAGALTYQLWYRYHMVCGELKSIAG